MKSQTQNSRLGNVALYWDPRVLQNASYYIRDSENVPTEEQTFDGIEKVVPAPGNLTKESERTQKNIRTLLQRYGSVFVYSDAACLVYHVYGHAERAQLNGEKFSTTHVLNSESVSTPSPITFSSASTTVPEKQCVVPLAVVMVDELEQETWHILRYVAFLAQTFPCVLTTLCSSERVAICTKNKDKSDSAYSTFNSLPLFAELELREADMEAMAAATNRVVAIASEGVHPVRYFCTTLEKSLLQHSAPPACRASSGTQTSDLYCFEKISAKRRAWIENGIGEWEFYAHELDQDELLYAVFAMLRFACMAPGAEALRLPDVQLAQFLSVVRESYRPSNPYHNFRHAVDVVQATFIFLLNLGCLPHYALSGAPPNGSNKPVQDRPPILSPIETLTILIVATGHDVGHPGVTNLFLTKTNAPLAKTFQYTSVLESYHSAVFGELLRKYWPGMAGQLVVESVLATDMGRHYEYMEEMEKVQEARRQRSETGVSNTSESAINEKIKTLLACVLIKCADISNVARPLAISKQWGVVLTKEFEEVQSLEYDLRLKPRPLSPTTSISTSSSISTSTNGSMTTSSGSTSTTVTSAADLDLALAKGQLYFISTFARPLFAKVSDLVPQLSFTMSVLDQNTQYWTTKLAS